MLKTFYIFIIFLISSVVVTGQARTSVQDGPWDNPATWGGLSVPDNNNGNFGVVTIRHTVTISQAAYPIGSPLLIDQVVIDDPAGAQIGKLVIAAGASMQLNNVAGNEITLQGAGGAATLDVNGELIANAGVTYGGTTTANTNFFSGSSLSTSTIIIPTATWNTNTSVTLSNLTAAATATAAWSNVKGNLAINCPSLGNNAINFGGFLSTIQSLDIQATNGTTGGRVLFRSGAGTSTVTINAGMNLSGDSRLFLATGGTQTVNLTGDFLFDPSTANFSQSVSGNGVIATINFLTGDFLQTNGEWRFCASGNASTTGTFNFLSGNMVVTAGTVNEVGSGQGVVNFTAPTGDQNFDLPATGIVAGSTINMTINKATSGRVIFSNSQTLGALTLTNGRLFLNGNTLTLNGAITSTNGVIDPAGGSISIAGAGAFTGTVLFEDNSNMGSMTLNRAGTLAVGNVTASSDIEITNLFLTTGTFQKSSGTLSITDGGSITRTAGTLTVGSPIVPIGVYDLTYNNNAVLTTGSELTASPTAIRNFTKQGTSTLTLNKNLVAGNSSGTFLISTGTFTASTFSTTLNGAVNTISSTANFSTLNVNGPLTQTSATTTTISGDLIVGASGSIAFAAGTTAFATPNTAVINNLGSGSIAFNAVSISNGSFMNAPSSTISIAGNFSGNGTFNNGSGTVVFNGTTTLSGAARTFNNVTVNSTKSLGGAVGWRVNGNLVNDGTINFTAGTLTWGSTGTFSGAPTATTVNALTVLSNSVLNLTLAGNMTISGILTLTAAAPSAIFNHLTTNDLTLGGAANAFGNGTTFTSLGKVIFTNAAATMGGNATSTKSFVSLTVNGGAVLTVGNNTSYSFTGTGNIQVLGTMNTTAGGSSTATMTGNTTILNTGFSPTFTNLTISGSLTSPGTINVNGNFTNNGTFNAGTGTVNFPATSGVTKLVSGSSVTDFYNITIGNTTANPDVRIQSNQNLRGVLTLAANAVFDADGSANTSVFTIKSTGDSPTVDAGIATLPAGAQVTGNVTVERFMSIEGINGGRIYRYISAPVQNATVADMQAEIPVTGSFTGTSVCTGCNTAQTMFLYNETVITDTNLDTFVNFNDGYEDFPINANSEAFTPGRGYAMFVRGNILASALWNLRGPINQGNVTPVTLPSTYTSSGVAANDGWNLVGNPYPSAIDWNAASGWTKTNIGNTFYVRDNGIGGAFATWNGVTGTNGGSRYIATGQAFWIQAVGAPVLSANENVKVAGQQTTFFREMALTDLLRVTLVQGTLRDETVIHFRSDAKAEFDPETDSRKFDNSIFNLSTMLNTGEVLAINSLSFACSEPVKLNITNAKAGTYRLDFTEFESFAGAVDITLTDHFLNKTISVISTSQYTFDIVANNAATSGANRFTLTFSETSLPDVLEMTNQPVCEGNSGLVSISRSNSDASYFILKDGLAVSDTVRGNGALLSLEIKKENLSAGLNAVIIQSVGSRCMTTKSYEGSILVNEKTSVEATPGSVCREGAIMLKATGSHADDSFSWFDGVDSDVVLSTASEFTTPIISKSRTYFASAISSNGCVSDRVPVLAEVIQYEDVVITPTSEGALQSNHTDGNIWYLDGKQLTGLSSNNTIIPVQSGTYRVEVLTEGCSSSFEYQFTVTALEESNFGNGIYLYPNPVSDKAYIDVPQNGIGIVKAVLYTQLGDVVKEATWEKDGDHLRGVIDMNSLSNGVYFVRLFSSNKTVNQKIIKK